MRAPNTQRQMTPEAVLLSRAAQHFESQGWSVREELPVYIPYHSKTLTADLVLTRDDTIVIIEGKEHLNPTVIAQADQWRGFAHCIGIVCRHPGRSFITKEQRVLVDLCRAKGFGLWFITQDDEVKRQVEMRRFDRASVGVIAEALSKGVTLPAASEGGPMAGQPSPLGAKAHREHDRWEKVRNYLAESATSEESIEIGLRPTATEIIRACDLDGRDAKDFKRLAPKGQIRGVKCHKRDVPYTYSMEGP